MPRPVRQLQGRRFGLLTVKYLFAVRKHALWACECDCGNESVVEGAKLLNGRVKSCGCWRANPALRRTAALKQPREQRKKNAQTAIRARWTKEKEKPAQ